ncbi:ankyrin [Lophiostoma macrostomum CBS 122681]|uniref:Ankyrin n=1 Tax=Lophiostoma macrostomum CBS 122681 TaxID=1314788 RepID=A0A6A6TCP6_9PLEO|nr:ankyrin [Lophiostoma macrostomum CBS 122681]
MTQMWLLKAAWSGHHDVVDALLEAHVSLEKDDFPHDALQAAIYCGQENVAMRLLRDIPNVNMTGGYFENALQAACLGGNHGLAMHLLEMGADANAWGRHGSPLKAACFRGHNEVVRLLIRYGATMNATNSKWNALEAAASRGHLLTCHILVETYPRVVAQKESRGSSIQSVFETALYMAALEGYSEIVEYLLKSGAGSFLPRALEAALRGCNAEVLRVLLAQIPKLENYTRYQTNKGTHTPPDAWVTVDFESLLNARNNLEDEWKAKESADGLQKERYEFFISRVPEASWWQQIRANRLDFCQALGMHRPQGKRFISCSIPMHSRSSLTDNLGRYAVSSSASRLSMHTGTI